MMLAEAITDQVPLHFAEWCGGTFFFLIAVNEGFKFVRNIIGKPASPPNDQLEKSLNTLTTLVNAHIETNADKHEHMRLEIIAVEKAAQKDLQQAIAQGNASREKMQDGMNELNISTAKLTATMETLITYFK